MEKLKCINQTENVGKELFSTYVFAHTVVIIATVAEVIKWLTKIMKKTNTMKIVIGFTETVIV